MMLVQPLLTFDAISLDELNHCLVAWNHAIGPWERPTYRGWFHGLRLHGELIAVTAAGDLITAHCAGGFTRAEAMELGRVCAARRYWCKAVLRLWRESVFPALSREHGYGWAISYQDTNLHQGDLYRGDGWIRVAGSRSGTDARSGRKGRDKVVWGWSVCPGARAAMKHRGQDLLAARPKRRAAA